MYNELTDIFNKKDEIKKSGYKLSKELMLLMYKETDLLKLHQELKSTCLKYSAKSLDVGEFYRFSVVLSKRVHSARKKADNGAGAFLFLNKKKWMDRYDQMTKESARKYEVDAKTQLLEKVKIDKYPFVLCSAHGDCAKDHVPYQGRIYIKESADENAKKVANKKRITKTMEWVLDAPAYMITRPNCRHYFIELTTKEVEENTVDELIKKYNAWKPIGQRHNQTMRRGTGRDATTLQNAMKMLDEYTRRINLHKEMYKIQPNEELKNAIYKDQVLINKWQSLIDGLKK